MGQNILNIVINTLVTAYHIIMLVKGALIWQKREKTCFSRAVIANLLLILGNVAFYVNMFLYIMPINYFQIVVGNIGQVLTFSIITESILTTNDAF